MRERNAERILEMGELPEDDVTSLLHVYCKGLAQAQPGKLYSFFINIRSFNSLQMTRNFRVRNCYH